VTADVDALLVSNAQFERWVMRHERVRKAGIVMVPERNDQMTGTYAMMDARGSFFNNTTGEHEYGPSGFVVGWESAWQAVAPNFDAEGFLELGGAYDWSQGAGARASEQLRANRDRQPK
jgi:hypothetical protein